MSGKKTDDVTGVETTGHSWDGIEELNNPLPRWWLWTFYGTIAWGIVYSLLFPAWPLINGATAGLLGFSTRGNLAESVQEAEAATATQRQALVATDLDTLADNPELYAYAVSAGGAVFRTWCVQCHGSGAAGGKGYPNLRDNDWLWGGSTDDIYVTISHGIRNEDDPDARYSEMPAFGEILSEEEVATLVAHVQSIAAGGAPDAGEGGALFLDNCAACHGDDAGGDRSLGAPSLTDAIWLYGGDTDTLTKTISEGPFGVMPAWTGRIGEANVRAVATYVHQLGGGE